MSWYVILNLAFSALVVGGIVGSLLWSIATQHRDPECALVRLRLGSSRPRPASMAAPNAKPVEA